MFALHTKITKFKPRKLTSSLLSHVQVSSSVNVYPLPYSTPTLSYPYTHTPTLSYTYPYPHTPTLSRTYPGLSYTYPYPLIHKYIPHRSPGQWVWAGACSLERSCSQRDSLQAACRKTWRPHSGCCLGNRHICWHC